MHVRTIADSAQFISILGFFGGEWLHYTGMWSTLSSGIALFCGWRHLPALLLTLGHFSCCLPCNQHSCFYGHTVNSIKELLWLNFPFIWRCFFQLIHSSSGSPSSYPDASVTVKVSVARNRSFSPSTVLWCFLVCVLSDTPVLPELSPLGSGVQQKAHNTSMKVLAFKSVIGFHDHKAGKERSHVF